MQNNSAQFLYSNLARRGWILCKMTITGGITVSLRAIKLQAITNHHIAITTSHCSQPITRYLPLKSNDSDFVCCVLVFSSVSYCSHSLAHGFSQSISQVSITLINKAPALSHIKM